MHILIFPEAMKEKNKYKNPIVLIKVCFSNFSPLHFGVDMVTEFILS